MLRPLLPILLSTFLFTTCKTARQPASSPSEEVVVFAADHYTPDAVSILPNGEVLRTPSAISEHFHTMFAAASPPAQSVKAIPVGTEQTYTYLIRRLITDDKQEIAQLVVVDQRGSRPLRALEFTLPYVMPLPDLAEIDAARTRWMRHCNTNEVTNLIENCYTANTLYYNHRPLISGRAALIEEYGYMKNPDYRLTLTPLHVEPVSPDFALELGQCSGSYGGQYFLVWQREEDGVWRVLLDGNL